jgi:hypothetical protein
MMRDKMTITAERSVDGSLIPLLEDHIGGVPVPDEKNLLTDPAKDLDIGARQFRPYRIFQRNIDRVSTPQGGMQTGEEQ